MEQRKTYKQLIELIPDAIYKTIENSNIGLFKKLDCSEKIYFVGSGSSYSVALYGAMLFNQFTKCNASAMPPREFIELGCKHSTVILLSQGGTNVDIIEATKKALELDCVCTAVTASEKSPFVDLVGIDNTILLKLFGEEECFVNSQGTAASFAVMLLLLDYVNGTNMCKKYDYYKILQESHNQVVKYKYNNPNNRYYYTLGTGFAKPAMHECVLKMNEVVLEDCSADDFKNFTHGKHLLQYLRKENRTFFLFSNLENQALAKEVMSKLQPIFDEVLLYTTSIPFPWSTFFHLFHVFNITAHLCELKGLPDPCYFMPPDVLLSLYKANP